MAFPMLIPVFFFQLFCGLFECEPNFGQVQIAGKPSNSRLKTRSHESSYNAINGDIFSENPLVRTKSGDIEGFIMRVINGKKIFAFEGIPYAEGPVGFLRFRNPIPKAPWEGVLQAKKPGPYCLQFHLLKLARITGVEDCLFMNIYTPTLPSPFKINNARLPVIIWIHGGGGWFGAGSEAGPSYLLQEDVILVTINYRLGVLGFLSTGDEENPGNYGLKDQSLAIQWVAENIQNFGGDPSKITLMGASSGATFVHLHLMSPLTKHLISGGISLSGSAFQHWTVSSPKKIQRLKRRFAQNVNCPPDANSRKLMECIRAVNPHFLIIAQRRLFDFFVFPVIIFHAVVESPAPGAFLTDTPENLYAQNEVARVPWICSQVTEEAEAITMLYTNTGTDSLLLRRWQTNGQDVLDYRYVSRNATETTEKVRQFYLRERNLNTTMQPTTEIVTEMVTDRFFRVGIHRSLQYHSRVAPTYGMRFGFRSEVGFANIWGLNPAENGVGHGADVGFYYNSSSVFVPLKIGSPSYDVSRMLINMFANFAYTGEPQLRYKNGHTARLWKPVTNPNDVRYLLVDNKNVINIPEPRSQAIRFWESLGLEDTSPNPFLLQYSPAYPDSKPNNNLDFDHNNLL